MYELSNVNRLCWQIWWGMHGAVPPGAISILSSGYDVRVKLPEHMRIKFQDD